MHFARKTSVGITEDIDTCGLGKSQAMHVVEDFFHVLSIKKTIQVGSMVTLESMTYEQMIPVPVSYVPDL